MASDGAAAEDAAASGAAADEATEGKGSPNASLSKSIFDGLPNDKHAMLES
jgi:hypothetical protein